MKAYTRLNLLYLCAVFILMLGLAVITGYINYSPIKQLAAKYKTDTQGCANELKAIEELLDNMRQNNDDFKQSLHEQYILIKRQLLSLILSGSRHYTELAEKSFMGVTLTGPYYEIVAYKSFFTKDQEQRIIEAAEEFCNENTQTYISDTQFEGFYAFIISFNDSTDIDVVLEYADELFEKNDGRGCSPVFTDIGKFSENLSIAVMNCYPTGKDSSWYNLDLSDSVVKRLMTAIRHGNTEEALYHLHSCTDTLHKKAPSIIAERYILQTLLQRINELSHELKTPLTSSMLNRAISFMDFEDIVSELEQIVKYVCENRKDPEKLPRTTENGEKILKYINENFTDTELTLDVLSEKFNLSNKYISTLITNETGHTYKDYLISLRISKAQWLLENTDLTVTEICTQCGYSHISHFIKSFKTIIGYTPSVYKRNHQSQ